ncbi:hypothetical protein IC784_06360 [Acinetobacter seifertii]|nr:hypothetical protein IC784_06360 [Acinetobacter seifertii]
MSLASCQAKGNIKLNADQVNSQSGLISSEDGIDLQSRQQVNNTARPDRCQ